MGYSIDSAIAKGRDLISQGCGYSQANRWSDDPLLRDCSSFVIDCIRSGGYDMPDGYTGILYDMLVSAGFTAHDFDGNLADCERGGVLLKSSELHDYGHTCMVSESGSRIIEAADEEIGTQERDIYICEDGWDWFFSPPADGGNPDISITYNGSTAEEGELGAVSDGATLGADSHWMNGFAAQVSKGSIWYQLHVYNGDWTEEHQDGDWVRLNDGQFADGIRAYYTTPDGETLSEVAYRVHPSPDSPGPNAGADWFGWRTDTDPDESGDDFGGSIGDPFDLLQFKIQAA